MSFVHFLIDADLVIFTVLLLWASWHFIKRLVTGEERLESVSFPGNFAQGISQKELLGLIGLLIIMIVTLLTISWSLDNYQLIWFLFQEYMRFKW